MWETCAERVREMGGEVLLEHHVSRIEMKDGRVTGVVARTAGGERRFEAEHVISSTDLRALVRTLGDGVPADAREAAEGLNYRDFLVVALMLDRENVFPDNWIYVHTPGVKVGRVQNFNNWSAAMVPEPGRTCLGMDYFCFEGDGLWTTLDAELVALASGEIDALGLARAADVKDGAVVRVPKAYPIYDGAYRALLDRVRAAIDPIPNLHTVGRNGMHKYNNADHSMYTAMLTLENMLGARHDVWSVNTDFEYHEEQRVTAEPATAEAAR
jgi:protoporphyrinogen oxidase